MVGIWKDLRGIKWILILSVNLHGCGNSNSCDDQATESKSSDKSASTCTQLSEEKDNESARGASCSDEWTWTISGDAAAKTALRCRYGVLGESKDDRLACSRSGYNPYVSSTGLFVYCVNSSYLYSFAYDIDFGSYKPWHCPQESSSAMKPVDAMTSDGVTLKLYCINGLLQPRAESSSGTQAPNSCSTKSKTEGDVFALYKLEDFQPEADQLEDFDPSRFCETKDTGTVPPGNVSGSSLGRGK